MSVSTSLIRLFVTDLALLIEPLWNRKNAVELLENKDKLKYVESSENSSKENYNKSLSSDQVSVSE